MYAQQQPVIDQALAAKLLSLVPEVLKSLPETKGALETSHLTDEGIVSRCLSYVNRLRVSQELFKDRSQLSRDVDDVAQATMMALNSLAEFHPHLEGNSTFFGKLSTTLKSRFTEVAAQLAS